jgi:hypothetical protein
MFAQIEKTGLGRKPKQINSIRLSNRPGNQIAFTLAEDVLMKMGAKVGDKLDVFVGAEADAGRVAFRLGFGPNAYTITKARTIHVPATAIGAVPKHDKGAPFELAFEVRGGQVVAYLPAPAAPHAATQRVVAQIGAAA